MRERKIVTEPAKIIKRGSSATLFLQCTSTIGNLPRESPFAKVNDFQINITPITMPKSSSVIHKQQERKRPQLRLCDGRHHCNFENNGQHGQWSLVGQCFVCVSLNFRKHSVCILLGLYSITIMEKTSKVLKLWVMPNRYFGKIYVARQNLCRTNKFLFH